MNTHELSYDQLRKRKLQSRFKIIGEIFAPAIPGIIAAGICAGFAALLAQLVPNYEQRRGWFILYQILDLINISFMTYMTAWIGYNACKRFGGTAILGGMLGMITGLDGINRIAETIGLYNATDPLNSVLSAGRGGILAALIGAWLIARLEKRIHAIMPENIDMVATPTLCLLFMFVPYVFVIMPATGVISTYLCRVLESVCMSDNLWVRIVTGYICAALFLPMVMMGMQYAFVTLYSIQLESMGYVTLFPALAMAGAGQVGAGIALHLMAVKIRNTRFAGIIRASIIPGMLGVGNPLLFGVTLPLGKPFLTSCLGGGFGGALMMALQVASTSWGPSGLLALPLVTAGPAGAVKSVLYYFLGLCFSAVMGFIITTLTVSPDTLQDM